MTSKTLKLARSYSAVLFDMDGTLVDSRAVVERVWANWAALRGVNLEAILAFAHGRRTIDTVRHFAPPGTDYYAEAAALEDQEDADTKGIVAVAGASELLQALPPHRWAVVTSASRELATRRLAAAGLPLPATLVGAEDVSRGKPDPEGYNTAARVLGTTASECLIFEDAPAGIQAGKNAGGYVVAIAAARPFPFVSECPTAHDFTLIDFDLQRSDR